MPLLWVHQENSFGEATEDWFSACTNFQLSAMAPEHARRLMRTGIIVSVMAATEAFNSTFKVLGEEFPTLTLGDIPKEGYATPTHQLAAQSLLGTWVLLAHGKKPKALPVGTIGGAPATFGQAPEAGWLAVVRVLASAAWAFAAAYVAAEYEDTIDRALSRGEVGSRLLAAQANTVRIVHSHAEREREAGQSLPYAPEEAAAVNALIEQQKLFSQTPEPPKDPDKPFPLPSPGSFFSGLGIGAVIVAGGLLWAFSQKGK